MRILSILAVLCALAVASPALAEEAAKEPAKGGKAVEPGSSVEMPFLIAPLNQDGKLVGYAYISAKVVASTPAAAVGIRNKTPFLQDAFVRDVNGTAINTPDAPQIVDKPALIARLLADAKRMVGATKVMSYVITQLQIAPAKPTQS